MPLPNTKEKLYYRGMPEGDTSTNRRVSPDYQKASRYLVKGGIGTYDTPQGKYIVNGDIGSNRGKIQTFQASDVSEAKEGDKWVYKANTGARPVQEYFVEDITSHLEKQKLRTISLDETPSEIKTTFNEKVKTMQKKANTDWELRLDSKSPYDLGLNAGRKSENNNRTAIVTGVGTAAGTGALVGGGVRAFTGQPTVKSLKAMWRGDSMGIVDYQKSINTAEASKKFTEYIVKNKGPFQATAAALQEINWKPVMKNTLMGGAIAGTAVGASKMLTNKVKYETGRYMAKSDVKNKKGNSMEKTSLSKEASSRMSKDMNRGLARYVEQTGDKDGAIKKLVEYLPHAPAEDKTVVRKTIEGFKKLKTPLVKRAEYNLFKIAMKSGGLSDTFVINKINKFTQKANTRGEIGLGYQRLTSLITHPESNRKIRQAAMKARKDLAYRELANEGVDLSKITGNWKVDKNIKTKDGKSLASAVNIYNDPARIDKDFISKYKRPRPNDPKNPKNPKNPENSNNSNNSKNPKENKKSLTAPLVGAGVLLGGGAIGAVALNNAAKQTREKQRQALVKAASLGKTFKNTVSSLKNKWDASSTLREARSVERLSKSNKLKDDAAKALAEAKNPTKAPKPKTEPTPEPTPEPKTEPTPKPKTEPSEKKQGYGSLLAAAAGGTAVGGAGVVGYNKYKEQRRAQNAF